MRKRTAGRIVTAAMLAAACVMGGIAYRDITHETGMEATYAEDAVRKASEEGATAARKHPTMSKRLSSYGSLFSCLYICLF